MIVKMNSKELSEILEDSQESIANIEADMNTVKRDLVNKLAVIKNEQEYSIQELLNIKELLNGGTAKDLKSKIVYARQTGLGGTYDIYGSTVHPKFVRDPNNIFNFVTAMGPVFKNNANIRINDVVNETQKAMLIHDGIAGKGIAFAEYDSANIKLEIEINVGDLLGDTVFNMIEIAPYLPGSFTINSIEVYKIQSYLMQSTLPDYAITLPINKVGACRIMLDQKYSLYKFVMNVTVNYQNRNGKYPFGLRHLYFYNADFDPASHVIAKIEKSKLIDWVSEDLHVRDQRGQYDSTCTSEGVQLFMAYNNSMLEYEIATSKGLAENIIARNTKELYVKLPLNRSIISLEFDEIANR
jgi:hypothetical protein